MLWLKRAAAVCGGVGISLLLFGVIVQFTDTNDYNTTHIDPTSGLPLYYVHSSVHEITGCYENTAKINNLGFHGQDVQVAKPQNVFRIVVVGSSFIEARQVPVADMFTTLLEQKLNAMPNTQYTYQVIPLGFNGNSTLLTDLYYTYYGSPLKPDLVIDLETTSELLFRQDAQLDANGRAILQAPPPAHVGVWQQLVRHSKLLINLYNRVLVFRNASTDFLHHPLFFVPQASSTSPDEQKVEQERWSTKSSLVRDMVDRTAADHAKLLYVTYVGREDPPGVDEELNSHFTMLAKTDGFSYDDLVPYIRSQEDATGVSAIFLSCDGHWSPAGHQYVSQELYSYLMEHPALLKK
jgi:hypothetical protein